MLLSVDESWQANIAVLIDLNVFSLVGGGGDQPSGRHLTGCDISNSP
jgi:hypothetical protein